MWLGKLLPIIEGGMGVGGGEWNDNTLTMEDTGRLSWLVFNQEVGNWQDQPGNIERVQVKITYLYNIHIYIS